MGATSGAHTAVEVEMTTLNWRTRVHPLAESALPGVAIVTAAALVAETAVAVTLSRVGPPA